VRTRELAAGSVAAPVLFVALWSTGFVVSKEAVQYAEPMTILTIRYGAATVLSGLLVLGGRAAWPDRRSLVHTAVVGLLLHAAYFSPSSRPASSESCSARA
jgi:drug/metabolite transporter (DMT)-like permease